jgi:hypothetical protein
VYENRIKSRGEAEKLSPGICKNKALGLFESVHLIMGGIKKWSIFQHKKLAEYLY